MVFTWLDTSTGYEAVCFYNRWIDRLQCFLRHPTTKRFVRYIRNIYIDCASSYVYCRRRTPTSNIVIRVEVVFRLSYRDYQVLRSERRLIELIDGIVGYTKSFMSSLFVECSQGNVDVSYVGVELVTTPVRSRAEYCRCSQSADGGVFSYFVTSRDVDIFLCRTCPFFIERLIEHNNYITSMFGLVHSSYSW